VLQILLSLATSVNAVPLPPISDRHGVRLPPPQHCLTNVNFSIVPNPPSADLDEFEDHELSTQSSQPQTHAAYSQPRMDDTQATAATATTSATHTSTGFDVDYDADADDPDASMTTVQPSQPSQPLAPSSAPSPLPDQAVASTDQRGTKRSLDEDEEYD
jgi:transcription initiation factor TFIID subunit 9B